MNEIRPAEVWAALPDGLRADVDDLLCRHLWFKATVAIARATGRLAEAQLVIAHRGEALYALGRIPPEPEVTVAELVAAVPDATPLAIEALWDGDSRDWIVHLVAIVAGGAEVGLGTLHWRRESEIGPGEEAVVKGQAVADRFGVPFYFHDPSNPGLDHPRWRDTR